MKAKFDPGTLEERREMAQKLIKAGKAPHEIIAALKQQYGLGIGGTWLTEARAAAGIEVRRKKAKRAPREVRADKYARARELTSKGWGPNRIYKHLRRKFGSGLSGRALKQLRIEHDTHSVGDHGLVQRKLEQIAHTKSLVPKLRPNPANGVGHAFAGVIAALEHLDAGKQERVLNAAPNNPGARLKNQTEAVFVRLTLKEKARVSAAAKRAKLPIATYVRVVLNAHLEAKRHVGVVP